MATSPVQSPGPPRAGGPRPRHVAGIVLLAVGADLVGMWAIRLLVPSLRGLAFDAASLCIAVAVGVPLLWSLFIRNFHRRALAEREALEQATRATAESEARYRSFVANTLEGIWLFGPDGRTTWVNDRMADLLDRPPADILGRTLYDFMDAAGRRDARAAVERGPESQTGRHEFRFERGDGRELWALVSLTPVAGTAGEAGGVLGLFTDVSRRHRAEDEARRVAAAFDQASDVVCITDADGCIVWVNGAFEKVSGYGRPEVLGKTPRVLKSGMHDAPFYADLWRTIRSGRVFRGMMINRRKDGDLYFIDLTITPIVNDVGRVTHFVGAGRSLERGDAVSPLPAGTSGASGEPGRPSARTSGAGGEPGRSPARTSGAGGEPGRPPARTSGAGGEPGR